MPEIDLLGVRRGSVKAPAGCGKTQLIADTIGAQTGDKPALLLTHTNAGKAALEERLDRAKVQRRSYRVFTIDSWAIRLASRFPLRSGLNTQTLAVENPGADYPAIRTAVGRMLAAGHLNEPLGATYTRLLVDEYQDCQLPQHDIVHAAAFVLPTVVLGDPLQAIFGFAGPCAGWHSHVLPAFPQVGDLSTPWRWRNAGAEPLGAWLLQIRAQLEAGQAVDLRTAPPEVTWVQLSADDNVAHQQRMEAARTPAPDRDGSVVIIGEARRPPGQRLIASMTPGATTVEAIDFRDLTAFGRSWNPGAAGALGALVEFAAEMMTNLEKATLLKRLETLAAGRATKEASRGEQALLDFTRAPSFKLAASALRILSEGQRVRTYRPDVYRICVAAMDAADSGRLSFYQAVVNQRERNRHLSRRVGRRAVGSTLLLKGLEADVSVVLYPEGMTAADLYVALTRGARRLVVCSPSPILTPAG